MSKEAPLPLENIPVAILDDSSVFFKKKMIAHDMLVSLVS